MRSSTRMMGAAVAALAVFAAPAQVLAGERFGASGFVDSEADAGVAPRAEIFSRALGLGSLLHAADDRAAGTLADYSHLVTASGFDRPAAVAAVTAHHRGAASRALAARMEHAFGAASMQVSAAPGSEGAFAGARDASRWGEAGVARADVGAEEVADELEWAAAVAASLASDERVRDGVPDSVELRVPSLAGVRPGSAEAAAVRRAVDAVLARVNAAYGGRALTSASLLEELSSSRVPAVLSTTNGSVNNTVVPGEIGRYQIALWLSIILWVFVFGGVYMMATMDVGEDSLLYSNFNPNWNKKSN